MRPASSRLRLTLQQTALCGALLLLFACAGYAVTWRPAALLLLVVLLTGLYGAAMWARSGVVFRPITELSTAAKDINCSELKRRFPASGGSEFHDLSLALNAMMARLEVPYQHLQEFPPNVSHELRRPLTNLRAEAEHALRAAGTEDELRAVLVRQLDQIDLITATIADLVELTRFGSQAAKCRKESQSLSELITASVDSMLPAARAQNIELTATVPGDIVAEIDTCQICRVLQNLIDNAIKYNRENGHVHVKAFQQAKTTTIMISDNGRGIPVADLPHIFERSFRSTEAKASCIQGSGLGLYFVKLALEAHGAVIEVKSVLEQGTTVLISLPRTRQFAQGDQANGARAFFAG